MVIDTFPFFNELDLLEIRFNILDPHVDCFVLVESPLTFSGKPKPLYYQENAHRFKRWKDKVIHLVYEDNDEVEALLWQHADMAPAPAFKNAFRQKEFIRTALAECNPDDVIYYGDVDEIWKPVTCDDSTQKLEQLNYCGYLNQRSSEQWRGTFVTKYQNIKDGSINYLRANPDKFTPDGGWHFTNLGGAEAVKAKFAAYDHQEFNVPWVLDGVAERLERGEDLLGRSTDWMGQPFQFWVDETDLPQYLKDNKDKYKHLWKS